MSENKLIDEGNPWKTLSSKIAYQNKFISFIEDDVITPAGTKGIYGYIAKKYTMAAVVLDKENNIYLVGQYRYPVKEYSWELIEGNVEEGEDVLDAAKRELKEEAGIVAKRFDVLHSSLNLACSFCAQKQVTYLVRDIEEGTSMPEATEKLKVVKIPFDEAVEYVKNGKIRDICSVAGIMLAKDFLDKEKLK